MAGSLRTCQAPRLLQRHICPLPTNSRCGCVSCRESGGLGPPPNMQSLCGPAYLPACCSSCEHGRVRSCTAPQSCTAAQSPRDTPCFWFLQACSRRRRPPASSSRRRRRGASTASSWQTRKRRPSSSNRRWSCRWHGSTSGSRSCNNYTTSSSSSSKQPVCRLLQEAGLLMTL